MSERIWTAFNGSRIIDGENNHLRTMTVYANPEHSIATADRKILRAARVSTRGENTGVTDYERDRKLLRYLWEHGHTSVFEQVTYEFIGVMPLYVAAQWKRHRTWHINEFSRRYSGGDWVEFEQPQWHLQNKTGNKQGGDEEMPRQVDLGLSADAMYESWRNEGEKLYHEWLKRGMAKEDARRFLPQTTMTCIQFTVDLKNLTDFIFKRCDLHAQREIRVLAYILKNQLVREINPWVHELIDEAFRKKDWPLDYH